jgi:D-3-phosphoglycerate dehydrogenase
MKVLFLDSAHPSLKKKLEAIHIACHEDFHSSKEEIQKILPNYNGIIVRSRLNIDEEMIDAFTATSSPKKFIARVGAGMEHIQVAYAERKGVQCLSSPEGNRTAVAEHTLGLLLNLLNHIAKANNEVKEGRWLREPNRGIELEGKTIGIYGLGNTGSAFAKLLAGFEVTILAYDKYKKVEENSYVKAASPTEIFQTADVLSLHLPLTHETNYLVNDAFLRAFQKKIYLLNTSRGTIVNTNDLAKNIQQGKVLGAGLDVLEYEEGSFELLRNKTALPEALQFLVESNRVLLTPHIAGWSVESSEKMATILFNKIMSLE